MGGIGVSCGYIIAKKKTKNKKTSSSTEIIPFHSSCNREMLFLVYVPRVIPNFHVESESLKTQLFQAKEKIISGLYLWSHIKHSSHLLLREKNRMRNEEYYKETSFLTL